MSSKLTPFTSKIISPGSIRPSWATAPLHHSQHYTTFCLENINVTCRHYCVYNYPQNPHKTDDTFWQTVQCLVWRMGQIKISSKSFSNFDNPVNPDFRIRNGFPDPDSNADCHQNVISWSLGHTPALHKMSLKSVGKFFDNPVNADFGLRTPGSGRWSGSSPKLNPLVPGPCPTPPRNFVKIRSQLFQLSDGQTNRQTDRTKNNLLWRR